nr:hypothetical protein HK105_006173 [Polyrhizophydium stewartii]
MPQDPAHSMLAKIAAAMGGADPLSVAAAALGGLLIALVIVPNMPARRRIPGPFKLPVLGNAPVLARGKALELFQLYFEKFGPLIALSVPGRTFLRTMDAALIHRALTDTDTFRKGEVAYKTAADLLGDALFLLPAGDRWRRHRKQLQPAFTPTQLRNAAPFIGRVADRLVDHLERLAGSAASGSAVVEIHAEFTALTFDVMCGGACSVWLALQPLADSGGVGSGLVGFSFDCKATESLRGGQRSEVGVSLVGAPAKTPTDTRNRTLADL